MSSVQQHGFDFEKKIVSLTSCFAKREEFFDSSLCSINYLAHFDLPSWKDPTGMGVPTSIKMVKRSPTSKTKIRVDMAAARRILSMSDIPMFRLLIGLYTQEGESKKVYEIREYIITGEAWSDMTGDLPVEMLERFSNAIKEDSYSQARLVAKSWKKKIQEHYGSYIRWTAKIDSKKQRRLQCFLYLDDLEKVLNLHEKCFVRVYNHKNPSTADVFCGPDLWFIQGSPLPWFFESNVRSFNKKEA